MIHGKGEISRSKRAIPKYFTKFELFGWSLDRNTQRFLVDGVGIVRSIVAVSIVGFRFSLLNWTICFSGSGWFNCCCWSNTEADSMDEQCDFCYEDKPEI